MKVEEDECTRMKVGGGGVHLSLEARRRVEEQQQHARLKAEEEARLV